MTAGGMRQPWCVGLGLHEPVPEDAVWSADHLHLCSKHALTPTSISFVTLAFSCRSCASVVVMVQNGHAVFWPGKRSVTWKYSSWIRSWKDVKTLLPILPLPPRGLRDKKKNRSFSLHPLNPVYKINKGRWMDWNKTPREEMGAS